MNDVETTSQPIHAYGNKNSFDFGIIPLFIQLLYYLIIPLINHFLLWRKKTTYNCLTNSVAKLILYKYRGSSLHVLSIKFLTKAT
jgi:hypothetical protein